MYRVARKIGIVIVLLGREANRNAFPWPWYVLVVLSCLVADYPVIPRITARTLVVLGFDSR